MSHTNDEAEPLTIADLLAGLGDKGVQTMRKHQPRPQGIDRTEWGDLLWRLKHGWRCCDCRAYMFGPDPVRWAPILKDDVWRAIECGKYTLLCFGCCKRRMQTRLGRPLARTTGPMLPSMMTWSNAQQRRRVWQTSNVRMSSLFQITFPFAP